VIAKLEKPEALDDLDRILEMVDGVMVARGDLGVEMPPEKVPVLQKKIIQAANARAKLVITATQMLESMISNLLPTRAEASDIANAIFDGTDAVMLSAESASGKYPVESVAMMARIVSEAESHFVEWGHVLSLEALGDSDAASMARAAHEVARDRDVAAIAVFTMQGRTALLISKSRPILVGRTPAPGSVRNHDGGHAPARGHGHATKRNGQARSAGGVGVRIPRRRYTLAKHGVVAYGGRVEQIANLFYFSVLAITNPTPINKPPNKNSGMMTSPRNSAPRIVPPTGCAKNVSEATAAGNSAKA
jgi:hypothetical protein